MHPVYDEGIAVYPVPGNHDVSDNPYINGNYEAGVAAWNTVFSGPYALPQNGPVGEVNMTFSVTHKNALIIGLHEYIKYREHMVNQEWLDEQLEANTMPHIFVSGHEAAFKVHHYDCLGYEGYHPDERDEFWVSLQNAGVRVYFAGHDHFYNHATTDDDGDPSNDVHQILVGAAGAPTDHWVTGYDGWNSSWTVELVKHAEEYGYVLVNIDGGDVTLTWMERVGAGTYQAKEQWSYTANASID